MSVEYARLSGALLAHLEFAAEDIERALRSIPKSEIDLKARLRKRAETIREIVGTIEAHTAARDAIEAAVPVAIPIPAWPGRTT